MYKIEKQDHDYKLTFADLFQVEKIIDWEKIAEVLIRKGISPQRK